jgi:hypothetical protein
MGVTPGALLICLTTAHLAGDFLLQTDEAVANKRKPRVLLSHAALVAALSYITCGLWTSWLIPLMVLAFHGLIDHLKIRFGRPGLRWLCLDQGAHLATVVVVAYFVAALGPGHSFWVALLGVSYLRGLVLLSGILLSVYAGAYLVGAAVAPLEAQLQQARRQVRGDPPEAVDPIREGFEQGGRLIGQFERALILLFVLVGEPGAIGFLIAAKSVFRFGEVREAANRMEAEYIIIGTLMSFLYGLVVAYGTKWLLAAL